MDFDENYLDLDSIMTSANRVPCHVLSSIYNVKYVRDGSTSKDILAGSIIEIPVWLVKDMVKRPNLISFEISKYYRKNYREIYKADAKILDLYKMGPYFYRFGVYLSRLDSSEALPILETIHKILLNRLSLILDHCLYSGDNDHRKFFLRLDHSERFIFSNGFNQSHNWHLWIQNKSVQISNIYTS